MQPVSPRKGESDRDEVTCKAFLDLIKKTSRELIADRMSNGGSVTDDDPFVDPVISTIESTLKFGLSGTSDFFTVLEQTCTGNEGIVYYPLVVKSPSSLKCVKTNHGLGRYFLRASLNNRMLSVHIETFVSQKHVIQRWYQPDALIRSDEYSLILTSILVGLSALAFDLTLDDPRLDASAPTTTEFFASPTLHPKPKRKATRRIISDIESTAQNSTEQTSPTLQTEKTPAPPMSAIDFLVSSSKPKPAAPERGGESNVIMNTENMRSQTNEPKGNTNEQSQTKDVVKEDDSFLPSFETIQVKTFGFFQSIKPTTEQNVTSTQKKEPEESSWFSQKIASVSRFLDEQNMPKTNNEDAVDTQILSDERSLVAEKVVITEADTESKEVESTGLEQSIPTKQIENDQPSGASSGKESTAIQAPLSNDFPHNATGHVNNPGDSEAVGEFQMSSMSTIALDSEKTDSTQSQCISVQTNEPSHPSIVSVEPKIILIAQLENEHQGAKYETNQKQLNEFNTPHVEEVSPNFVENRNEFEAKDENISQTAEEKNALLVHEDVVIIGEKNTSPLLDNSYDEASTSKIEGISIRSSSSSFGEDVDQSFIEDDSLVTGQSQSLPGQSPMEQQAKFDSFLSVGNPISPISYSVSSSNVLSPRTEGSQLKKEASEGAKSKPVQYMSADNLTLVNAYEIPSQVRINESYVYETTPRIRSNKAPSWSPPTIKLILDLKEKPSKKETTCHSCYRAAKGAFKSLQYCYYSCHYFCQNCISTEKMPIPALILHRWDFEEKRVSQTAYKFLTGIKNDPLFNPSAVNPQVLSKSSTLRQSQERRQVLSAFREYILTCRDRDRLMSLFGSRIYMMYEADFYSLTDLIEIKRKTLIPFLDSITQKLTTHIFQSCETCRGHGSICNICSDPRPIYAFQIGSVTQCETCFTYSHKTCFQRTQICLRCQRRNQRSASLPTPKLS